mgnify:CR=1 FL=1
MILAPSPSLLLVTSEDSLGVVVAERLRHCLCAGTRILRLTYSDCAMQLTSSLIEQTGFFVVDLLRQYPGGLRAEGVVLAERLARRGKSSLVISPLFVAHQLSCPSYWDVSSTDTLVTRIVERMSVTKPQHEELKDIGAFFMQLLRIPPQH